MFFGILGGFQSLQRCFIRWIANILLEFLEGYYKIARCIIAHNDEYGTKQSEMAPCLGLGSWEKCSN
ncbi:hypothetical protein NARC_90157 [Candidatus Nitrosocosmicus arcticus]|uniref:Uncharacterized protein n=1 Tax=Candidatus Nitrosocosmicus arcticus TaxID=2035267 RepID=A0A557SUH4_9ARCH|nr:hypothetical protein NARC_90157 [Candidatus Nitrosocosmicus arcticus]